VRPGSDAAVLRLADTGRGIAATVDGNGRYVQLAPRRGAAIAVAEAARNLACSGARPLAITNCLNFGNPTRPAVYHQLREAVAGLGEACRMLGTPVTGGNVSLYNETPAGPIYPTPVVGMVGVLEDVRARIPSSFRAAGDAVLLVGRTREELGASEFLATVRGTVAGQPPALDLEEAARLVELLLEVAGRQLVRSAHDVSDGGLAVALAECAILAEPGPLGVDVDLGDGDGLSPGALLFGESQSRVVLSCAPGRADDVAALAGRRGLPCSAIGTVGRADGEVRIRAAGRVAAAPVRELAETYDRALPRRMEHEAGLTT